MASKVVQEEEPSEDYIIERRFIAKEPQLIKCLKRFTILANSVKSESETHEGSEACYQNFVRDLAIYEQSMSSLELVQKGNQQQMEAYTKLEKEIEENMTQANKDIASLKIELGQEKLARQQKEEYEKIAIEINKFSSRQDTKKEIEKLSHEIENLKAETAAKEQELELRRKKFGLFFHAAQILASENDSDIFASANGNNKNIKKNNDAKKRRQSSDDVVMKT